MLILLSLTFSLSVFASAASVPVIKTIKQTVKTTDTVAFTWTTEGKAISYNIYSYSTKSGKYKSVASLKSISYSANNLNPGESYSFGVKPVYKKDGKKVTAKMKTIRCTTALDSVSKIKQGTTTSTSHSLSWSAVKGAEKYMIYYYRESDKKFVLLGTKADTSCTVSNLASGKTYKYKIKAVSVTSDGKEVVSEASKIFSAYTKPATVSGIRTSNESTTSYHLEWNPVANAEGYIIYRFNEKTGRFAEYKKVQGNSFVVRELTPAKSDVYRICAYTKLAGKLRYSENSEPFTATTKPETVTPVIVSDKKNNNKIKLTWNKDVTADGYLVYASTKEDGSYILVSDINTPDTNEFTNTGLQNGTVYYYKIKTFIVVNNQKIYSAFSSTVEAYA